MDEKMVDPVISAISSARLYRFAIPSLMLLIMALLLTALTESVQDDCTSKTAATFVKGDYQQVPERAYSAALQHCLLHDKPPLDPVEAVSH